MPTLPEIFLAERQRFPRRDAKLLGDEIDPGHQLGDGMFDLEPRVHFEEIELATRVDRKLHGPGVDVTHRLRRGDGRRAHPLAQLRRHERRRRFFDDLLMPSLHRTFALEHVNDRPVMIAEHLNFDVMRSFDETLEEHRAVAERLLGLGTRSFERFAQFRHGADDADSLSAAARRSLQHKRESDPFGGFLERVLVHGVFAGYDGHARRLHPQAGLDLVAHRSDRFGRRAHEDDAGIATLRREDGVLGKESVPG
jgi:S-adenosylmethionine:diacylglycerol 3-amino-3-carboxypropyl transferase